MPWWKKTSRCFRVKMIFITWNINTKCTIWLFAHHQCNARQKDSNSLNESPSKTQTQKLLIEGFIDVLQPVSPSKYSLFVEKKVLLATFVIFGQWKLLFRTEKWLKFNPQCFYNLKIDVFDFMYKKDSVEKVAVYIESLRKNKVLALFGISDYQVTDASLKLLTTFLQRLRQMEERRMAH